MELERVDISNDKLHQVVINVLTSKRIEFNLDHLKEVSKWLDCFIRSEEKRLILNLPFYDYKDQLSISYYFYYYYLAYDIVHSEPVKEFNGYALFDIFGLSRYYESPSNLYVLPFLKEEENVLYFGNDTVLQKNNFMPIFNETDLRGLTPSDESMMSDLFILFSEIAKAHIISNPIKINLQGDAYVFVSKTKLLTSNKLIVCIPSEEYNLDDLDELLTNLETRNFGASLFVGFPGKRSINPTLYNEFIQKTKTCEIYFNKRFSYSEIEDYDIMVLPKEDTLDISTFLTEALESLSIFRTEHAKTIIDGMRELKIKWGEKKFNPYKTPFPSRWMLFVRHEYTIEHWIELYKNDFPEVDGETLQNVISVMKLIYEINWVDKYFVDKIGASILITDSRIFPDVVSGFYRFIEQKYNVNIIDSKQVDKENELILVDSFNLINLCNVALQGKNIQFVIPDFLYFNHVPQLKNHFISYFTNAILSGLRSKLDPSYAANKNIALDLANKEVRNSKLELKSYYDRFGLSDQSNNSKDNEQLVAETELDYDEISSRVRMRESKVKNASKYLVVTTDDDQRFDLRFNSEVLIKEGGVVIGARALSLTEGLEFLPKSEVTKSIDQNALASRLSAISEQARNWKVNMHSKYQESNDLYNQLKLMGLSVQEGTFVNDYTSTTSAELGLPRSKRDWQIVCEILKIEDFKESWRNHKCKGDYNRLKKAYLEIISILTNSEINGVDVDDDILEQIRQIFLRHTGIADDEFDGLEEAQEIVENISREIKLLKVKKIEPQLI